MTSHKLKKRFRDTKGWKFHKEKHRAYWDPKAKKELLKSMRPKPKKRVPLTAEQKAQRIEKAIRRLGDNEALLEQIKKFIENRLMELPMMRAWAANLKKQCGNLSVWGCLSGKWSAQDMKKMAKVKKPLVSFNRISAACDKGLENWKKTIRSRKIK